MNRNHTPKAPERPRIFSQLVGQLASSRPPDDTTVYQCLAALQAALVRELKRRRVWDAPPAFLRVLGPSWTANDREALNELTQDAYLFIFVQRQRILLEVYRRGQETHQPNGPDVGPLVLKLLRQFVTQRQKLADPVGYCVYCRLHEAAVRLIANRQLYGPARGDRIGNGTVLYFEARGSEQARPSDAEELARLVERWIDPLHPRLVTALGKAVIPLLQDLRDHILSLRQEGVVAFRFGDLVTPLKKGIRGRWQSVWRLDAGVLGVGDQAPEDGFENLVPLVQPDRSVEYGSLLDCVHASIGQHQPSKTQGSLWYLWLLNRSPHRNGDEPRRVSVAKAAQLLEVSRRQVSQLFRTLQGMVRDCLSAFGETPRQAQPIPAQNAPTDRSQDRGRGASTTQSAGH